jgi:hypothetical protein
MPVSVLHDFNFTRFVAVCVDALEIPVSCTRHVKNLPRRMYRPYGDFIHLLFSDHTVF